MSSSPDPQTWVFPPLGAKDPPSSVAAIFGPIAKGDKIDLVWTPASEQPDVALLCTNDNTVYTVSTGRSSPFQYTFSQTLGDGNDNQDYICHLYFPGTDSGNTITFQYLNAEADTPTTWQQDSQLQSALSAGAAATSIQSGQATVTQTITASASASTFLTTVSQSSTTFVATATGAASLPETTPPAASNNSNSSSSGLSAGAGIGIGVGAAVVFFGLLAAAYFLWRKLRANRQEGPIPTSGLGIDKGPAMNQPNAYPAAAEQSVRPMQPQQLHNNHGIHEVEG